MVIDQIIIKTDEKLKGQSDSLSWLKLGNDIHGYPGFRSDYSQPLLSLQFGRIDPLLPYSNMFLRFLRFLTLFSQNRFIIIFYRTSPLYSLYSVQAVLYD